MKSSKDYSFCELREKEVVNTVDGRRLGHIIDIAFTCTGQIFGLIVPAGKKLLKSIGAGDSLFIPWRNICKIGSDVILVELGGAAVNRLSAEEENVAQ